MEGFVRASANGSLFARGGALRVPVVSAKTLRSTVIKYRLISKLEQASRSAALKPSDGCWQRVRSKVACMKREFICTCLIQTSPQSAEEAVIIDSG